MKTVHTKAYHAACGIFLAGLFIFLSVRASDHYRWSDYNFADAQVTLALDNWNNRGWLDNFFLVLPQGYSSVTHLFDQPELRHHARGLVTTISPRIGPRLRYTHYPSGYLMPYAILYKMGITDIIGSRILSVMLSVASLGLMYLVFSQIANPAIALITVIFYGLSKPFLGYADSVFNSPMDDFLRFLFMLFILFSTRSATDNQRRKFIMLAWLTEFGLSLCSFDSVFFLYAWLIGWDVVDRHRFDWKKYLFFSFAPIVAHGIQFLQNIWYLGFDDALLDMKDTFFLKNPPVVVEEKIHIILNALQHVFTSVYPNLYLVVASVILCVLNYIIFSHDKEFRKRMLLLIALLFICGAIFIVLLPQAALFDHQGRQMAPFVCFLFSVLIAFVLSACTRLPGTLLGSYTTQRLMIAYVLAGFIVSAGIIYQYVKVDRSPKCHLVREIADPSLKTMSPVERIYHLRLANDIALAEQIGKLKTMYSPVYFDLGGFQSYYNLALSNKSNYPQINPLIEYYTGRHPVLCFRSADLLIKDLVYIAGQGIPFSPVITARDSGELQRFYSLARITGLVAGKPRMVRILDRIVMDMTDSLEQRWRTK